VAVVIVARLGASLNNLILALGLMGVPAFYRLVRSSTLSARHMPYAEAAFALGATDRHIMWRHVFPNILSPLVVLTTIQLGTALLTGSSLSFIGLGAQPPLPEWGALLAAGRNYFDTAWWLAWFPGLAVTFTVVGLNLIGDGLRDALDPRLAARRSEGWGREARSAVFESPRPATAVPGMGDGTRSVDLPSPSPSPMGEGVGPIRPHRRPSLASETLRGPKERGSRTIPSPSGRGSG